jgi:predicted HAD superfamily phosphohydrolase
MIQLVLTEEQQRFIAESKEPVEIVGRSGQVLTTVIHGYTESELREVAEAAKNFVPSGTLRELLDRLKLTQPVG